VVSAWAASTVVASADHVDHRGGRWTGITCRPRRTRCCPHSKANSAIAAAYRGPTFDAPLRQRAGWSSSQTERAIPHPLLEQRPRRGHTTRPHAVNPASSAVSRTGHHGHRFGVRGPPQRDRVDRSTIASIAWALGIAQPTTSHPRHPCAANKTHPPARSPPAIGDPRGCGIAVLDRAHPAFRCQQGLNQGGRSWAADRPAPHRDGPEASANHALSSDAAAKLRADGRLRIDHNPPPPAGSRCAGRTLGHHRRLARARRRSRPRPCQRRHPPTPRIQRGQIANLRARNHRT